MIFKYYTADCIIPDRGITTGTCMIKVYFWQSPKFAYDKLCKGASENKVRLSNFRRVK